MPRFTVDVLDVLMAMLREDLEPDGVTVMSRIPDGVEAFLPLVTIRRTGGSPVRPDFYDQAWMNVQTWCADDPAGVDQYRAAGDLADRVRGIFWNARKTQRVMPGLGHIVYYRESSSPIEISDPDLPQLGRYTATYDLRIRPSS